MSHELEIRNGKAAMAWKKDVPWHGLGTEITEDATMAEWMEAADLNWEVSRQPLFSQFPNGEKFTVKGRKGDEYAALVRDRGNGEFGDEDMFGVVGPEWVPVQNHEVFAFMEKFCKAGNMSLETCGALKGGTEIWALAKFAEDFDIIKGDQFGSYLLFHNAHIWGKGNQIKVTPIRVVCNNTLTMAVGQGSGAFRMPHIRAFDEEVQSSAERALGLAAQQMDGFKEQASVLSRADAREEQVHEFITDLYQPNLKTKRAEANENGPLMDDFSPTSEGVWEAVNFAPGSDLKGSKGTWWGVFNGVTYFEDHLRISYQDSSNVLAGAWFGAGAKKKEVALERCMAYAEVA